MATRRDWPWPGAGVPAPTMVQLSSESALNELLSSKEEEWRAQHSLLQEAAVREAQGRLQEAQDQLQHLQEDFLYNLQVLAERDSELEHYDAAFAEARGREEARQAEASELRVEVAKLRQALAAEARQREELQRRQQLLQQEHRLELERAYSDKNGEIERQREHYEHLKWKLEQKLEELDGELALQRQELLLDFESELQKRERAFQQQAEDMGRVLLSHELKVKLLSRELEALTEAGAKASECLQRAEAASASLESQLQARTWELRDLEAVKDARIKDLEDRLRSMQLSRTEEEGVFKRKHEELDRLARERDAVLATVKGAHGEQLRALETRILELQAHCESLEVQLRRAEWTQADAAREKDAVIDKLREDSAALRSAWDAQVAQLSQEAVSKDLQVQALQQDELKLKAQLARVQQDVDRYKQQLSLAMEREQSLARQQVQLGLDWQRRCEDTEREQIQRSEALIEGLTASRAQVAAKLQETERALREQERLMEAVVLERDQALQALRVHGLLPPEGPQCGEGAGGSSLSSEIRRLQEQNASLRHAVAHMRREMESLGQQLPPSPAPGGEATRTEQPRAKAEETGTPDYALALEAEVQHLKHRFAALEEQLEGVLAPEPHPQAQATGDAVRISPECTGLALRKLGDRVRLLNMLVTRLRRKVLPESLKMDALQRELPQEVEQVHLEVLELRKQVAELGKHLGAAQQEGEQPAGRKPHCPCSPGAFSSQGPPAAAVGADAQGPFPCAQPGPQTPQALSVHRLQKKLKEAAQKILRLRLEKEQLIEMGNRLRAELGYPKGKPSPHALLPSPESLCPQEVPALPADHGLPLGQVQPHLAAQRQHPVPTATCSAAQQKENRFPPPRLARPEDRGCPGQGSSSLTGSSLQDTWKLLDLGSSPSGLTSQEDSAAERPAKSLSTALAVEGVTKTAQPKSGPARPSASQPAKPRSRRLPPRVRNYNIISA
ncbi:coiled-coil domain-containing protein 57 isoform X2 [Ochotona princeps]|uniref:coiled-coil domain-containing protein 57 isoform X2 n=1 Tax=Ochotona princeps TaxID=9978 RepID=UPI0027145FB1|nr:coiled-coil domain-containing protein 57 isoform X2 [Ochotona princeps]